jgi:hypothetical protein
MRKSTHKEYNSFIFLFWLLLQADIQKMRDNAMNKEAAAHADSKMATANNKDGRSIPMSPNTDHFDTVSKRNPFEWINLITGFFIWGLIGFHWYACVTMAAISINRTLKPRYVQIGRWTEKRDCCLSKFEGGHKN